MIDAGRLERAVAELLEALGEDPSRPQLARTPERVAAAAREWFAGSDAEPDEALREARFLGGADAPAEVALAGIPFTAFCEHHLVPFTGTVDLAYEPREHLVGLGRLYDLVELVSRRLTLQERMGELLVDALMAGLDARGAIAVVDATHACVASRGGRHGRGRTVSTHARGSLGGPESGREGLRAGREALDRVRDAEGAAVGRSGTAPFGVGDPARLADVASTGGTVGTTSYAPLPGRIVGPRAAAAAGETAPAGPPRPAAEIMGILNVTPDSFSDGGRFERDDPELRTAAAIAEAERMLAEGATIIDVGGESTRPGAERVPPDEELARVLPVVRALAARGVAVSVDTMRASTAAAALDAGARVLNDVSGGRADGAMLDVAAASDATFILSHWRGHSRSMATLARYDDPARDIRDELVRMRDLALARGVAPERIVLDPGLGFAKTGDHNWAVLSHLDAFLAVGHPLLIGASRKRFLGEVVAPGSEMLGVAEEMRERDLLTAVLSALVAERGAWGVRVHDVRATRLALEVAESVAAGRRVTRLGQASGGGPGRLGGGGA